MSKRNQPDQHFPYVVPEVFGALVAVNRPNANPKHNEIGSALTAMVALFGSIMVRARCTQIPSSHVTGN